MTDNFTKLKKYNFWSNNLPEVGLIRNRYLEKINDFLNNKLIKVLIGQRRVGKSYLLRQIIFNLINNKVNPENIFYLNKEITDFDFITDYTDLENLIILYREKLKPRGKIYLLIDEIQNIKSWEKLINSYSQNYAEEYEIFISGSNSELLAGELAGFLSGRYIQFVILPFSYFEFIEILKIENSKKSFLQYLNSGGLPELFKLPNEETKRHYIQAIKDTVLLRDIIQRYNIKDAKLLEDIFIFLINNASNLISINNIVKYFGSKKRKTNYETVANYIQYLKNTFLIYQVEKYNIKGKEILSGTNKYYINDLCFKNYLYPGYLYGVGYMLENIVFLELLNSGYQVYIGYLRNKEIDFVAIKNDRTIYVQVAYILSEPQTIEREYSGLRAIPDNFEKYVVSLDDIQMPNIDGIKHIQAWKLNEYI